MANIIVGDDHPLVQAALRSAFADALPHVRLSECYNLDEVMAEVAKQADDVDLVLLDLNMPGTNGFAGLFAMLQQYPTVPVAILSAIQEPSMIRRAIHFGASGYIPKSLSLPAMADAISEILRGNIWVPPGINIAPDAPDDADAELARRFATLSVQQLRILTMIVEGRLNKQIAGDLGIAEQTVKVHVSTILRKLRVISRTQAAVLAERLYPRMSSKPELQNGPVDAVEPPGL